MGDGADSAAVVIVPRGTMRSPSCENKQFQFEIILMIPAAMSGKLRLSWSVRRTFGIGRLSS